MVKYIKTQYVGDSEVRVTHIEQLDEEDTQKVEALASAEGISEDEALLILVTEAMRRVESSMLN